MTMPDSAMRPADASVWAPLLQQRTFRRLMNAFAYPGRIGSVADIAPDSGALRLVLATLLDGETSLADPDALVAADDWQRLQVRRAPPAQALFVVARGDGVPAWEPCLGSLESPEQGATLILQVARLGEGAPLRLSGPGIEDTRDLRIAGLDPAWLDARARWNGAFPMGVDWLLVDDARLTALPRTTRIEGAA